MQWGPRLPGDLRPHSRHAATGPRAARGGAARGGAGARVPAAAGRGQPGSAPGGRAEPPPPSQVSVAKVGPPLVRGPVSEGRGWGCVSGSQQGPGGRAGRLRSGGRDPGALASRVGASPGGRRGVPGPGAALPSPPRPPPVSPGAQAGPERPQAAPPVPERRAPRAWPAVCLGPAGERVVLPGVGRRGGRGGGGRVGEGSGRRAQLQTPGGAGVSVPRERVNKCRVYRAPAAGCPPRRSRAAKGARVWRSRRLSVLNLPSV